MRSVTLERAGNGFSNTLWGREYGYMEKEIYGK